MNKRLLKEMDEFVKSKLCEDCNGCVVCSKTMKEWKKLKNKLKNDMQKP